MKLLYSTANPFARKVRACAAALGVDKQITLIEVDIAAPSEELTAANPLGKIPVLITEDGFAIFDSRVICEYLNGTSSVIPIIPLAGAQRWLSLRLEALGDGLMTAAVLRRHLLINGMSGDHDYVQRQRDAITRTLDWLEREKLSQHVDVGILSIACGLGYLDLRFADEDWRAERPKLAAWFEAICEHDCLKSTAPKLAA